LAWAGEGTQRAKTGGPPVDNDRTLLKRDPPTARAIDGSGTQKKKGCKSGKKEQERKVPGATDVSSGTNHLKKKQISKGGKNWEYCWGMKVLVDSKKKKRIRLNKKDHRTI